MFNKSGMEFTLKNCFLEKNGLWISIHSNASNENFSGLVSFYEMEGDIPILYLRMILESNGITYDHEDYSRELYSYLDDLIITENKLQVYFKTIYDQDIGVLERTIDITTVITLYKE